MQKDSVWSEIRQPFPGVQGNGKGRLNESFASADIVVVSLKNGLAGYMVPSKRFGILAAGRPYIAAVKDESEVAELTRK